MNLYRMPSFSVSDAKLFYTGCRTYFSILDAALICIEYQAFSVSDAKLFIPNAAYFSYFESLGFVFWMPYLYTVTRLFLSISKPSKNPILASSLRAFWSCLLKP